MYHVDRHAASCLWDVSVASAHGISTVTTDGSLGIFMCLQDGCWSSWLPMLMTESVNHILPYFTRLVTLDSPTSQDAQFGECQASSGTFGWSVDGDYYCCSLLIIRLTILFTILSLKCGGVFCSISLDYTPLQMQNFAGSKSSPWICCSYPKEQQCRQEDFLSLLVLLQKSDGTIACGTSGNRRGLGGGSACLHLQRGKKHFDGLN